MAQYILIVGISAAGKTILGKYLSQQGKDLVYVSAGEEMRKLLAQLKPAVLHNSLF